MAIVVVLDMPGMTQAQYEQSAEKVAGRPGPVKSPADWPVTGLISHTAAPTSNGWLVVDVWESEEAFQQFGRPSSRSCGNSASRTCNRRHTRCSTWSPAKGVPRQILGMSVLGRGRVLEVRFRPPAPSRGLTTPQRPAGAVLPTTCGSTPGNEHQSPLLWCADVIDQEVPSHLRLRRT